MIPTLFQIKEAQSRIQPYLSPTPLRRANELEERLNFNGKIFLKLESEQPTGSFKVRGAFNNLLQFNAEQRGNGVIARSSGNFAQAVAYAAKQLNIRATIIMPTNAPKIKIEGTKSHGAEIQLAGDTHEEGQIVVDRLVKEKGYVPVHPYNSYPTIAGQGTVALEILAECPSLEHFFCPIGGGGLMSGCAIAFKEIRESIRTYGIEPEGAGDYHASRQSGKREIWEKINTIADGLRASSVGELNYPILNRYVDATDVVSEKEIKGAMKMLYDLFKIISEPSGAVALAGFLKSYKQLKGTVVILITGKNVDPELFDKWIGEK